MEQSCQMKGGDGYAFQKAWATAKFPSAWASSVRSTWYASAWKARYENRNQDVKCSEPRRSGIMEYGCGQCIGCRINKKRLWTGRCIIENAHHAHSAFVTLTYDEKNLPEGQNVSKEDVQEFIAWLRQWKAPRRIRYYAAGEYGEKKGRPHYHLILFGINPLSLSDQLGVKASWLHGQVHFGTVTSESIAYCAGYVAKNALNPLTKGRTPEFQLMSLRPGIGLQMVDSIVKQYQTPSGQAAIVSNGWISNKGLRITQRIYPLGGTVRAKIIRGLGFSESQKADFRSQTAFRQYIVRVGLTSETLQAYERQDALPKVQHHYNSKRREVE